MNGPPARRPARNIVQIRHLDVDQAVRKAGIATEMLAAALDHAFDIAPLGQVPTAADKVIILSNSFAPGGEKLFKKFGFTPVSAEESKDWSQPEAVGLFKWKGRWLAVTRGDWTARRAEVLSKK
jgi:RimJ/RimL family protein N-acetyltransferase